MVSFLPLFLSRLSVAIISAACLFFFTSPLFAKTNEINKVKLLVARLQLQLMQVQEILSKKENEELDLLEQHKVKIDTLTKSNDRLAETLGKQKLEILVLQEKLTKYQKKSNNSQFSELNQFATILALASVGETDTLDTLLLELINKGNNLQKDLLILLLAENQKNQGLFEPSLGYYGELISDYPNSPYLNRAIFEASELLGELGHTDEQKSMLLALKESDDPYGELARGKICNQFKTEDPLFCGVLFGELVGDEWVWFKNGNEKTDSKYQGEIRNGVPNGKGTLFFPNGEKHVGEFKYGKFQSVAEKDADAVRTEEQALNEADSNADLN